MINVMVRYVLNGSHYIHLVEWQPKENMVRTDSKINVCLITGQAVGLVAGLAEDLSNAGIKLGSAVATITYGGFSEFKEVLAAETLVFNSKYIQSSSDFLHIELLRPKV